MIAILCPSRHRPAQFRRMCESVKATTRMQVDVFACVDEKDLHTYKYVHGAEACDWVHGPDGMPTSHKWNMLAQEAMRSKAYRLFMLGADDMVFTTPGWDKALMAHYDRLPDGRKAHVYALRDSRDPEGTPHIIVTREWIECLGYFVPPVFLHWYVDSWTVEIARANACFTHMKDYELMHIKPSDEGSGDDTHNRIRGMGWRERDAFVGGVCKDWLNAQIMKVRRALV